MATWEFPGSQPIDMNLRMTAGSVAITAADTDLITVSVYRTERDARSADAGAQPEPASALAGEVRTEFADGRLDITEPEPRGLLWRNWARHYVICLPSGSRCTVQAVSADVTVQGEAGSLDVHTASGHVDAKDIRGPARITTVSGNVSLGTVAAEASLQTASGRIGIRQAAGEVAAKTVSGMIHVGSAGGSVDARTASGRVRIDSVAHGRADVNTVSGDIELKVAPQTGVYLDLSSLSGRVTSDLEPSGEEESTGLCVQCRSVSGTVHVTRALSAEVPI